MEELPKIRKRDRQSHKGEYGRVVVVGGSVGMSGAPALAGIAALRSGAGLVSVATGKACLDTVAGFYPALMTIALPCSDGRRIDVDTWKDLESHLPSCDVLAIGPGMGTSATLEDLSRDVFESCPHPVVFDADGLNNLAACDALGFPPAPRIFTPHPGEFSRLASASFSDRSDMENAAVSYAAKHRAIVVLKGHHTLITDGEHRFHNQTGNPGMATGGSGDVLTGITAALLGQDFTALDATRLACHLHGRAGDLAALELGETSLIATDLVDYLPPAIKGHCGQ